MRVILKPLICGGGGGGEGEGGGSASDSAAGGVTVAVLQRPVHCTESRPLPRGWGALPPSQSPTHTNLDTTTPSIPPNSTQPDRSEVEEGGSGGGEEGGCKASTPPSEGQKMDGDGIRQEEKQSPLPTAYGTTNATPWLAVE